MYEKRSVFTDSERCILHFSEFIIDIIFVNVSLIAFQKMLLSKSELFCIRFFPKHTINYVVKITTE